MKKKSRTTEAGKPRRPQLVGDGPLGPAHRTEGGGYVFGDQQQRKRPQSIADVWLQAPGNPDIDPDAERELVLAVDADAHRRHRARLRSGIAKSAAVRWHKALETLDAVESIKRNKHLSDVAACLSHLEKENESGWLTATQDERLQKAKNLAQSISNTRRKKKHLAARKIL